MDTTGEKLRYGLIPYDALDLVVRALMLGAKKHGDYGWATLPDGLTVYHDAIARHLSRTMQGEAVDEESGLPPEAHIAADALLALAIRIRESSY